MSKTLKTRKPGPFTEVVREKVRAAKERRDEAARDLYSSLSIRVSGFLVDFFAGNTI
jgi:hypothetical protein